MNISQVSCPVNFKSFCQLRCRLLRINYSHEFVINFSGSHRGVRRVPEKNFRLWIFNNIFRARNCRRHPLLCVPRAILHVSTARCFWLRENGKQRLKYSFCTNVFVFEILRGKQLGINFSLLVKCLPLDRYFTSGAQQLRKQICKTSRLLNNYEANEASWCIDIRSSRNW